jgi:prepilin-type N-terminal cleavage/methylation domain-containing protein
MRRSTVNPTAATRGFTLIEVLIVIGLIVLLTGLTVTVSTSVMTRADIRETELTLQLLDQAMAEWEASAERKLTWNNDSTPGSESSGHDVHRATSEVFIISEMLDVINRVQGVRQILGQINPEYLYTYERGVYPLWVQTYNQQYELDRRFDGSFTVLDAWGTPIYATHPGNRDLDGDVDDPDGTVRTWNENYYGPTKNQRICFVSAGPDRQFGSFRADASEDDIAFRADNIFSYPIDPAQ